MIWLDGKFQIGNVHCPDKSISHRALILASISKEPSKIFNVSLCKDVLATVDCLQKLGATIVFQGSTAFVTPISKPNNKVVLDCQNSGTTARLLCGLVCGLGVEATFVGDQTLCKRPMDRVQKPLEQMGAKFKQVEGALFATKPCKLVGTHVVAEVKSAQVKSAVLLAGLFAEGKTTYTEQVATRNHTENMLVSFGCNVVVDGLSTTVQKGQPVCANSTVPNDFSSVAFPLVLAVLSGKSATFSNVCTNPLRTGLLQILQNCGLNYTLCNTKIVCGEQVADLHVFPSKFGSIVATESQVVSAIDEIPLLAVVAIATKGTHKFFGVRELQFKECNRIQAIVEMAKKCNCQCLFDGDNLTIVSQGNLPTSPHFCCHNDHRMAMCGVVLANLCGGGSVDGQPFDVSFPNFLQCLGIFPKNLALVGSDISQSKSPILMRNLAKHAGICITHTLVELPKHATDQQLMEVYNSFDGLNVTMPFKERYAQLLGANCPAVNTIGRGVVPQTTDGYGMEQAIASCGVNLANLPIWVVGAGGAAKTALCALQKHNCKVQVLNRTQSHVDSLAKQFHLQQVENPVGVLTFVPECQFEQQIQLPPSVEFVLVSAYKGQSGIKKQAEERHLTVVEGLQMLYHQGAKSFALWTGTPIQNNYLSFQHDFNNF
ncbi:MAG: hypothetical protein IKC52_06160 [Clostridia bacterium]|nr:hypothetical protein [Clostridia bacterium]